MKEGESPKKAFGGDSSDDVEFGRHENLPRDGGDSGEGASGGPISCPGARNDRKRGRGTRVLSAIGRRVEFEGREEADIGDFDHIPD